MGIADELYECGAIKFGEFMLHSGKKSPVYLDMRVVPSWPDIFRRLAMLCTEMANVIGPDIVAGVATGGVPWATIVAYESRLPLVYVREAKKGHATRKLVEGFLREGSRILLVDDVATTGTSLLEAAKGLREVGGIVSKSLVVVDRGQGAKDRLKEQGIELLSVYTLSQLLDELARRDSLREKVEVVVKWLSMEDGEAGTS
jgi:orotate phosphoribosyltransferase